MYSTGAPEDLKAAHDFQDRVALIPLSSWGKQYTALPGKVDSNVDMRTPVRDQVNRLSAQAYFAALADLMKKNPPTAEDALPVAELEKLGIIPGQDFDLAKVPPEVAALLPRIPQIALKEIKEQGQNVADNKLLNGWALSLRTGTYGTNYLQRAYIAAVKLGANLPEDTVYATSISDAAGRPYSGASKYVLRFEKDQLPPTNAFWSLTLYDPKFLFVPNSLNRHSLSSRSELVKNPDGSVDLYLQHDPPSQRAVVSNWLPAPSDKFTLMLRTYWPKPEVLDGTWTPPPVRPATRAAVGRKPPGTE
jgi:hypothetical protein